MVTSSRRPGQVRFEAWVPEDLYRAFQAKHAGRRKQWLVNAMRREVFGERPTREKPDAAASQG
jgi:hypothetical protein